MEIIHIIQNEKFTEPFIEFINSKFNSSGHTFYTYGNGNRFIVKKRDNVHEQKKSIISMNFFIKKLYKSQKVIIHGLFSPYIVLFLFLQPWLLKKCYWGIWGGDLYYHVMRKKTIKSNVYEYFRKSVIKKMGGFITHIKGDYKLAKQWYGVKGKYFYSFMYPSNLYKEYYLNNVKDSTSKVYIQIGNSADPSNNHIEVLNKLHIYKAMDIEIICPLSYGDKDYAKKVINYGTEVFGNKFMPIKEFMPFDKYLDILAKIDIAIFNHKRQQAIGSITTLLGLGKKVYIREDITTWQFCIDHDLRVYSVNGDFKDLFEDMDNEIKHKNIENVKRQFSEEKLINDIRAIFETDK